MKAAYKLLVVTFILGGLIFARDIKKNPRVVEKRAVNDHYIIIKDQYHDDDKQLDRKRSHKRRRKIRKPLKGLR